MDKANTMSWYGFDLTYVLSLLAWIAVGILAYIHYRIKESKQKLEARIQQLEDEMKERKET